MDAIHSYHDAVTKADAELTLQYHRVLTLLEEKKQAREVLQAETDARLGVGGEETVNEKCFKLDYLHRHEELKRAKEFTDARLQTFEFSALQLTESAKALNTYRRSKLQILAAAENLDSPDPINPNPS
ncbi:unnamed protein product [Linum tenue]|uniref:Uncharacterized protein n=1 Tax=Linum tenue TaxID=586396 RepID=A0AAV0IMI4_9ROSI|nr:unnamed protein product [Linum tenue]